MKNNRSKPIITLYKGKKPSKIPAGSTLAKEWAKNTWYVNYTFNGKQYRVKEGLNRIKDCKKKLEAAEALIQSINDDFDRGYDPANPEAFFEKILTEDITLSDAIEKYLEELSTYTRRKTVGSYRSKLHYLNEFLRNKQLQNITSNDIQKYIYHKIHSKEPARIYINGVSHKLKKSIPWTQKTVKAGRGVFRAFFNWCITNKYFTGENPVTQIDQKRIRSEVPSKPRNIPFSPEDITLLMNYLDNNDKSTAFFARIIYSTCMRPSEICKLRICDIDLKNRQIKIPLDITKNTKKTTVDIIDIEPNLIDVLMELNIASFNPVYFLTSKSETIIGEESIGSNKPYKQFAKALKTLSLHGKGYTLYSFKHFSNLQRFQAGWTVAEIMKANRHSSITMTEIYLRDLNKITDISKKEVPKI